MKNRKNAAPMTKVNSIPLDYIPLEQRSPEFIALLQELFDLKAVQLVEDITEVTMEVDQAWAYISMHNLMDRLLAVEGTAAIH